MILQTLVLLTQSYRQETDQKFLSALNSLTALCKEVDFLDESQALSRGNLLNDEFTINKQGQIWTITSEGLLCGYNPQSGSFTTIIIKGPKRQVSKDRALSPEECKEKAQDWLALCGIPGKMTFGDEEGSWITETSVRTSEESCTITGYQTVGDFQSRNAVKFVLSRDKGQLEQLTFSATPIIEYANLDNLVSVDSAKDNVVEAYLHYKPFSSSKIKFIGKFLSYPLFVTADRFTDEYRHLVQQRIAVPLYAFHILDISRDGQKTDIPAQIFEVDARTGRVVTVTELSPMALRQVNPTASPIDQVKFAENQSWTVSIGQKSGFLKLSSSVSGPWLGRTIIRLGEYLLQCDVSDRGVKFRDPSGKEWSATLDRELLEEAKRRIGAPFTPFSSSKT